MTETKLPPGIGFACSILCQAAALFENMNIMEVTKARYPSDAELHHFLMTKAAVPGATTTQTTWASPLVYAQKLVDSFIQFLRPQTIIGKFGSNGIPSLTRVPFQIRVPSQTNGGDAYWVGEGAPKPLTAFGYSTVTLTQAKVAAISVITRELVRFSSPAAETLVRDALARAVVDRIDTDFVDPAHAVSAGIQMDKIEASINTVQALVKTVRSEIADFRSGVTKSIDKVTAAADLLNNEIAKIRKELARLDARLAALEAFSLRLQKIIPGIFITMAVIYPDIGIPDLYSGGIHPPVCTPLAALG